MTLKPLNIRDHKYAPALGIGDWMCLAGAGLATIFFVSFLMTGLMH